MSNPERLVFEHVGITEEICVTPHTDEMDTPRVVGVPRERDIALVVSKASNEWFGGFIRSLRQFMYVRALIVQRVDDATADVAGGDCDPGFGVDPTDSAQLLQLRQAIDSYIGWGNRSDEERGDYVARIRQIGDMLWDCKGAFLEGKNSQEMARILLSALQSPNDPVPLSPEARTDLDAGLESARKDIESGGSGGKPWPGGAIGRLLDLEREHSAKLELQVARLRIQLRTQRAELRRFNREARARNGGAEAQLNDTFKRWPQCRPSIAQLQELRDAFPQWANADNDTLRALVSKLGSALGLKPR